MNGKDKVPLALETAIRDKVVEETTAVQQRDHLAIASAPTTLETCLTIDQLRESLGAFPPAIVEATIGRYFPDREPEDALVREGRKLAETLEEKATQLEESLISVLNGIMASKKEYFDIKLTSFQSRRYSPYKYPNSLTFNLIGYETNLKKYKLDIKSTTKNSKEDETLFEIKIKYVPRKWYTRKEKREIKIRVNLDLINGISTGDRRSNYFNPHELLKHIFENIDQHPSYQAVLDELAVLPSLVGDYLRSRVRRAERIEFKKVE